MPFTRPTLKELDERIRNDITGAVRIRDTTRAAPILRRSVVGVKARAYAGACHMQYGYLDHLARQRFAHSMDDEFLDAEGAMYNLPRKGDDYAHGKFRITGNEGAIVPEGQEYQFEGGISYKVISSVAIENGIALVSAKAVAPGRVGNVPAGAAIKSLHPAEGIDSTGIVDEDGFYDGTDTESDDLYRARILERKRQPPHGGAWFDYVMWAKEVKGVTRAWCLPLWMGMGTVGVMFTCDSDTDPIPNDEQCKKVWEHIDGKRPVTAEHFVFPPERLKFDVALKLYPDDEEVRQSVSDEVDDFLFRDGGPDVYLHVSRLSESISAAVGEHHHELIWPVHDIHVPKNALPVPGQIEFANS